MKNSIPQTMYIVIDQSGLCNDVLFESTNQALAESRMNAIRDSLGSNKNLELVEIKGRWSPVHPAIALDMGGEHRILLIDGSEVTNAILQSDGDWWHKHPSSGSGGRFIDPSDVSHYFVADYYFVTD